MRSSRPYMIRAMHEWIIDSEFTPYVLVDATHADTIIPRDYVEDGKILLNVSPSATQNLNLGNEYILFSARFNNVAMEVSFPIDAVLAIYAKENGRGMMFKGDESESATDSSILETDVASSEQAPSGPIGVDSDNPETTDTDPDGKGPSGSPSPKKPSLKIVK